MTKGKEICRNVSAICLKKKKILPSQCLVKAQLAALKASSLLGYDAPKPHTSGSGMFCLNIYHSRASFQVSPEMFDRVEVKAQVGTAQAESWP